MHAQRTIEVLEALVGFEVVVKRTAVVLESRSHRSVEIDDDQYGTWDLNAYLCRHGDGVASPSRKIGRFVLVARIRSLDVLVGRINRCPSTGVHRVSRRHVRRAAGTRIGRGPLWW